jgi:hypothetical protein
MKSRVILGVLAAVMVVGMVSMLAVASQDETGNGAPSGSHYNLNIIGLPKGVGYDKDLNDNFDGGNGSRIFISRSGTTQIYVYGGTAYDVKDHDGTDGTVGTGFGEENAGLILPYADGQYQCDIYARIMGPQGSSVKITGQYYYAGDYYPIGSFTLNKNGGGTKFVLHNAELLNDDYQDILWTLDEKTKFRICQLRIYVDD